MYFDGCGVVAVFLSFFPLCVHLVGGVGGMTAAVGLQQERCRGHGDSGGVDSHRTQSVNPPWRNKRGTHGSTCVVFAVLYVEIYGELPTSRDLCPVFKKALT